MRHSILLSATLCLSLAVSVLVAEPARAAKTGTPTHASKDVRPGSYEDWCSEHGVPESMCTRCDKSLIPAFKATGDWDEKHGLPKSQCKKCNPKLKIVRPAKGSK